MAITAAMRQDIMELAVITNNAAPGTTLLAELVTMADSGSSLTDITAFLVGRSAFKATYPTHQTSTEFGAEWIGNILPEASAELQAECVGIVEAHINGGGSIPALIVSVQAFMSDAANATGALKTHIDNFNNKVTVATYHTITQEAAGEWTIPATVTSSADTVTAGNATVDAAVAPEAPVDVTPTYALSGAATANEGDTVNYTISTTNVASGGKLTYTITGVEGADVSGGALTGQATIGVDGKAVIPVSYLADLTTEGEQTATITAGGSSVSTVVSDTSLTPAPVGKTYSLTAAPDTFTGNSGDDTFIASVTNSWSTADAIDGVSGTDAFNVTVAGNITVPVAATVSNVDSALLVASGTINVNAATWTGLTSLTGQSVAGSTLAAPAGATITNTDTALAAGNVIINSGTDISVTNTGVTTGGVSIGAVAAPTGTITVNSQGAAGNGVTHGAIGVKGGTTVSITQGAANAVLTTKTAGAVTVTGTATTTNVTSDQEIRVTASGTKPGYINGAVTITDVNRASTTKAGTITDVTVKSGTAVDFQGGGLQNLNLEGTVTTVDLDALGILTVPLSSLNINLNDVTASGAMTVDSDIKTLNIASNTKKSTLADLDADAATAVNISGDAKITLTAVNNANAAAVYTVTNTAGATIGAIPAGATFVGGDGADSVTLGASTKGQTLGAGNDTAILNAVAALGTGGSIDAGDGIDILAFSTVANAVTASASGTFETSVSNFETLALVGVAGAGSAINLANLDDINVAVSAGDNNTGNGITFNNATEGFSLTVNARSTGGHVVNLVDSSGAADSISLGVTNVADLGFGTFTANSIETINFNSDDTAPLTALGAANPNTMTATLSADKVKTLTITGDAGLALTNTSTTLTSVNASGMTNVGLTWATVGNLAKAATITGSPKADNIGGTANNTATATVSLTMDGGLGQDTLQGGAGPDTITDSSIEADLDGNSLAGGGGADTITGGPGEDSVTAGAGNDSVDGGAGNDAIVLTSGVNTANAGDGIDTITGGTGNDTMNGDAGNDVFVMGSNWNSTDVISGGDGIDTISVNSFATLTTAGTTTGVEAINATFNAGAEVLNVSNVTGLSTITAVSSGANQVADISGIADGVTVALSTNVGATTLDTAAGASLTVDVKKALQTSLTITDAANVTIKNTGAVAGDTISTVLDAVDTVRLDVDASSGANIDVGAVTGTNKLATVDLSANTSGRNLAINTIADADALTSLTLNAVGGNIVFAGAVGGGGNAEGLADITVNASNSATATILVVNMDDSQDGTALDATAADLAATVTGSATFGATANLGSPTNTFGTINLLASGAGAVNSTLMRADDITGTISAGGTHTALTATDDVTVTTTNGAGTTVTIGTLTTGATLIGAGSVTHTGAGNLAINATGASAGTLTVDGSASSGTVKVVGTAMTGKVTATGGSGKDTLTGGSGSDVLTGNDGIDTLTPGAGSDTLSGGAGNDVYVMGANWSSGDSITDSAGTDALSATVASSITPAALSGIETVNLTLNGGSLNASGITDVATLGLATTVSNATAVVSNLASTVTKINVTTDVGLVNVGYAAGSTNDLTLDMDGLGAPSAAVSFTLSNQGGAFTLDGDATHATDLTTTVLGGSTSVLVLGEGAAVDLGDTTAASATSVTITDTGGGNAEIGTLAAAKMATLTVNNAGTAVVVTGATTASTALKTIDLNSTSTGGNTIGAVTATAGTGATSVAVDIDWTGVNGAANTMGALDVGAGGTISSYDYLASANNQTNTVAAITADTISSMAINVGNGGGTHTWASLAAVDNAIGNVSITAGDNVTFSTGATDAKSIGNITLTATNTTDIAMGVWGDAGWNGTSGTVGDITISGSHGTGTTITIDGALSVGAVSTAGVTVGTVTVVLDDQTLIGTTMTGGAGVDAFTGTGGADTITAKGGNDTIDGGIGADNITTGTGNDVIILNAGDGADTITDFAVATDKLDYNTALRSTNDAKTTIAAGGAQGSYQAAAKNGTVAATDVIVELTGQVTDGTGADLVTKMGTLATNATQDAGDKFLIANYTATGAQVWLFTAASDNVTAGELTLLANLTGVAADALATGNFI